MNQKEKQGAFGYMVPGSSLVKVEVVDFSGEEPKTVENYTTTRQEFFFGGRKKKSEDKDPKPALG